MGRMWNKRILIHCCSYFKRIAPHQHSEYVSICGAHNLTSVVMPWKTCRYVHTKRNSNMVYNKQKSENNLNSESKNMDGCMHAKTLQSCPTLRDPMDCSLPGSSVHGILQARIPEWIAISSSRGSFWPRYWIHIFYVSCIGRWVLYHCTTWEALILN